MAKYRKLPVVIEAREAIIPEVVHTLEGDMRAEAGDMIITGVEGEVYPCKRSIFEATYEEVVEEPAAPPVVELTVRVTPEDEAVLDVQALREGHADAAGLLQHFADLRLKHFGEREHEKAFRAQYESVPAPLSNAERAAMEAKGRG